LRLIFLCRLFFGRYSGIQNPTFNSCNFSFRLFSSLVYLLNFYSCANSVIHLFNFFLNRQLRLSLYRYLDGFCLIPVNKILQSYMWAICSNCRCFWCCKSISIWPLSIIAIPKSGHTTFNSFPLIQYIYIIVCQPKIIFLPWNFLSYSCR